MATANTLQPAVLIIDLGLPDMSGLDLAKQLRAQDFTKTPLIALSGYGDEETRQAALAVGFNHHMSKPADIAKLRRLLAQMLTATDSAETVASQVG
ncbi:MAG: response regulator [Candidatus Competibacteraceae bacterium]